MRWGQLRAALPGPGGGAASSESCVFRRHTGGYGAPGSWELGSQGCSSKGEEATSCPLPHHTHTLPDWPGRALHAIDPPDLAHVVRYSREARPPAASLLSRKNPTTGTGVTREQAMQVRR